MLRTMLAVSTMMMIATSAQAGTVTCTGTVQYLSYQANNVLALQLSSMNAAIAFCSPDTEWTVPGTGYKTGPQSCKALYATFLSAKLSGATVVNMVFDGDQVPATCNSWTSWSSANIRYFYVD